MDRLRVEKPTSDAAATSKSEWALVPSAGSCTRLGNLEPCVNKAMMLLRALGELAAKWKEEKKVTDRDSPHLGRDTPAYGERTRALRTTFSPYLEQHFLVSKSAASGNLHSASFSSESSEASSLVVVGTQTGAVIIRDCRNKVNGEGGFVRKQLQWLSASTIIDHTLQLVLRLEDDRRECTASYEKERERVQELRSFLDRKQEDRLIVLAETVQREHELCARDILELKWHVSFDGRELGRLKQNVKTVSEQNSHLQSEVKRLRDHIPLVEEKLEQEEEYMKSIRFEQREKNQALLDARDRLSDAENKTKKTSTKVNAVHSRQKQALEELRNQLDMANGKLSQFRTQNHTLTQRVSGIEKNVASNLKHKKLKEEEWNSQKERQQYIRKRVQLLETNIARVRSVTTRLEDQKRFFSMERNKFRRSHKSTLSSLTEDIQHRTSALWQGREAIENTHHEMDAMREWIASCIKQQADDIKAIERAKLNLQRVHSQLEVVEVQTAIVRKEHHQLSSTLQSDELRLGSLENDLKAMIKSLKDNQHIESRRKLSYEGKIKSDMAELDKKSVEYSYQQTKALDELQSLERTRDHHQSSVNGLEIVRAKLRDREDDLVTNLEKTKQELDLVERELTKRQQSLVEQKGALVEEEEMKRKRLENVRENIKAVTERTEDTQKRMEMMGKMEKDTLAAIEILEAKKQDALDKIAVEKEEEESWRKELAEISDFSTQASKKHHHYFMESEQHYQQLEADMFSALSKNEELASCYCSLLEKFIHIKGLALKTIEKQLEIEAAIRDSKQLLALQTYIFPAVQAYYQQRSQAAMQKLRRFVSHCSTSHTQVQDLQKNLQVVVSAMHSFLESHVRAQADITAVRALTKKVNVIGARDLSTGQVHSTSPKELFTATVSRDHLKSREKVVTFARAVTCT